MELFLLLQFTANVARRLSHDLRHPGHNPASLTVEHKELRMGGWRRLLCQPKYEQVAFKRRKLTDYRRRFKSKYKCASLSQS